MTDFDRILPRALDLAAETGRRAIVEIARRRPRDFQFTPGDIEVGLNAFFELVPTGKLSMRMLTLDSINIEIVTGKSLGLPFAELVGAGQRLLQMKHCPGFAAFVAGFGNPTQFSDTLFELNCAFFCFKLPESSRFRFSPDHRVGRERIKKPDFDFVSGAKLIVCECKVVHHDSHKSQKRFEKIATSIVQQAAKFRRPVNQRLDVLVSTPPDGDLDLFAIGLATAAFNEPVTLGSFRGADFKLAPRQSAPSFDGVDFSRAWIDPPVILPLQMDRRTGLTDQTSIWVGGIDRSLARTSGQTIREAARQIPPAVHGVIFLHASRSGSVQSAIDRRLYESAYSHILAGAIDSGQETFDVRCRSRDAEIVASVFRDPRVKVTRG